MAIKSIFQNNFKSGELGVESYGRFDLDMYGASSKVFKNGVTNTQGSITNKTLIANVLMSPNVAIEVSKFFEYNVDTTTLPKDSLVIMFQEAISRCVRIGTMHPDKSSYYDSLKTRSKIKEFATQIGDDVFYTTFDHSGSYETLLKGATNSETPDYTEDIQIFMDETSKEGIEITDITSDTATVTYVIEGNILKLTVTGSDATIDSSINVDKYIPYAWDAEVPDTYFFDESVDGINYKGTIGLTETKTIINSSYIYIQNSVDEINEETPEYILFSSPFQFEFLDPSTFKRVTETRYIVYKSDKSLEAHYYGLVDSKFYKTDYKVSVNNSNEVLTNEITSVLNLGETIDAPIKKYIKRNETLTSFIKEKPSGTENTFGDELNAALGRDDINFAMWRYDITDDIFEVKFYEEAQENNAEVAPEGALTFTPDEETKIMEIYIQGGIGRLDSGSQFIISSFPQADTMWVDNVNTIAKVVWKNIKLKSMWFKTVLDLTRVKVTAFYSGRLILANTKDGSNVIAFSALNNIQSFAKKGIGILDPFVTNVTTTPNMSIEKIVGYKSLMLFTDKGIFASKVNTELFDPTTTEFPIVTKIIPSATVDIAFLNEGMAFVNSTNNRVYLAYISDSGDGYRTLDLNVVNESIVRGVTDMINVEFNNDTGYSYLLIHSNTNDCVLQYVKAEEILSWTRLDLGSSGFRGSGVVNRKTFTVNATRGVVYEIGEGFTDTTIIETLPPNSSGSDGVPALYRNNFQHLSIKLQVNGKYDISINGIRKSWEFDREDLDYNYIVEFPQIVAGINENLVIKILTKEKVTIQGILITTNI